MVERTRAIRYVHLGGVHGHRGLTFRCDVIVQVPRRSRWGICYASPAARRAHDQTDVFCLRANDRRDEEVASQFVLICVWGDPVESDDLPF